MRSFYIYKLRGVNTDCKFHNLQWPATLSDSPSSVWNTFVELELHCFCLQVRLEQTLYSSADSSLSASSLEYEQNQDLSHWQQLVNVSLIQFGKVEQMANSKFLKLSHV